MGNGVLPSITVLTAPHHPDVYAAHPNKFSTICQQAQSRNSSWCCFCTSKYGGRADGSQWESRNAGTHKQQSRYPHDEFSTEDNGVDETEHSGFKSSVKQRIWWSEDSSWDMDEDDDDDDDDDVIETGFPVFEGSFGFSSIFKNPPTLDFLAFVSCGLPSNVAWVMTSPEVSLPLQILQ